MILKKADDKAADLKALEALLARPGITAEQSKRIEQQLRNMRSGIKGEAEAGYEIDFVFQSDNWIVIHDLRLEHKGQVAQIDHLLLNRTLECYVIESKRFSEGIGINEHGECVAFYGSKPVGVPSPFEQNAKHCLLLERMVNDDVIKPPRRMGLKIRPAMVPLVMVSKNARISRPKKLLSGLMGDIIKADQLMSFVEKRNESASLAQAARLIGTDTLAEVGRQLVSLHRPARFNWAAKFGLADTDAAAPPPAPAAAPLPPVPQTVNSPEQPAVEPAEGTEEAKSSKLVCKGCGVTTPFQVARFCWLKKRRFGGNVYCRDCQTGK